MSTLTENLKLARFCKSLLSEPDFREVYDKMGNIDFTVDNVRFIAEDCINEVLADELSADEYVLGVFNAWFIADQIGVDQDVIEAMQEAEAFEAIGKLILSIADMEEFAAAYASADGYGHHFNSWDGGEESINYNGQTYLVFDNH